MMFGAKGIFGITYKTNEGNFDLYRRKFVHDFKVNIVEMDLDGSRGLAIETMNAFLVSQGNLIRFFDQDTFKEVTDSLITIPLFKSETREPNEIISMQMSGDE